VLGILHGLFFHLSDNRVYDGLFFGYWLWKLRWKEDTDTWVKESIIDSVDFSERVTAIQCGGLRTLGTLPRLQSGNLGTFANIRNIFWELEDNTHLGVLLYFFCIICLLIIGVMVFGTWFGLHRWNGNG
jgi:hypothetical protein